MNGEYMLNLVTVGQFIFSILGAGTVGGLASGQLNRILATRESRKKHLGGLLCDLLELRHGFNGIIEVRKALASIVPGQIDQVTIALPGIFEMVGNPAKLHEHYESAIIELAAIDPLLAFQLRSKNLVVGALNPVSKLALQSTVGVEHIAKAFNIFGDAGMSALDDAILRVAKELGKSVHRKTREILQKTPEMPDVVNQVFALIPDAIRNVHVQTQAAENPITKNGTK
jgi:hypothetical protein